MSFAILVRPLGDPNVQHLLAYDIVDREEAAQLASNLVASYPVHGTHAEADAYWFGDRDGLHEVWVEAV